MFGLKLVTKKQLAEIEWMAKNKAVADLVELLRKKDKIFIEPVTLVGDNQVIRDCVFLGTGHGPGIAVITKCAS
jgi:hypothetical protein